MIGQNGPVWSLCMIITSRSNSHIVEKHFKKHIHVLHTVQDPLDSLELFSFLQNIESKSMLDYLPMNPEKETNQKIKVSSHEHISNRADVGVNIFHIHLAVLC